ncbi:sensor histidine kinase [Hymenobacter jejuensis]|uniref:histidine kinase n=1 Tax=Hymenobacter jejuensis TaxID=2502781 RepID=A0A5B7ZXX6_9BACT|nr:CHASE3 domain-containing protein [Hymenobacter jejuensis]QDA59415.1 GHKL domain-containing protein [Hymenobacter jejuensis]
MRLKLNTKILLGFSIALAVLLATSLAAYFSIQRLGYYTRLVGHTYKVLQHTSDLRMRVRDGQSSVRGYLLLNDSSYLATYSAAVSGTDANLDSLRRLTADNPVQQRRLDTLRQITEEEKVFLNQWRQKKPSADAARALLTNDQALLNRLRDVIQRMRSTEEDLLHQRNAGQDFYEKTTPIAIIISAVIAIITVLWLFRKISQEVKANDLLQAELEQVNLDTNRRIQIIEQLADKVVQGDYSVQIKDKEKDSLGNLATSLNRMTQTLDEVFGALEKRNQELDQFAYVASHDLKAPLRGVNTVVKWIEEELSHELSDQMRSYLAMMKGRLSRLEDLINGLLQYARVGRTQHQLEEVNVHQLVSEVVEMVVPLDFTVEFASTLPTLTTDRLSLQQVFTNLISNAVKYHDRGAGTITVSCRERKRAYEFTVADNGPGIAPEFHEKIFLMFQTLRDRHTAESTGIGLSIVRKIIEEERGSIHVESDGQRGAAFVFTWPKVSQASKVSA